MARARFILTADRDDRAIGIWLLAVAFMVFTMIVVGGATRLTESGLSIVEWKPVSGILPPLSESDWQREFESYKAFPQYRTVNRGMDLEDFKTIYWWEYVHRLLGRLIGLAFALPLLYFIARGRVRPELRLTLFFLLALGASQGLLGWYMVQSGLVDVPAVSHYRLAAHLGLALVIFAALLWVALGLLRPGGGSDDRRMARFAGWLLGLVGLQSLIGALVAGLDAGRAYNSWPLMDGRLVPAGLFQLRPWWANLVENVTMVQFEHRMTAYLLLALAIYFWFEARRRAVPASVRAGARALFLLVFLQAGLGIATLLNHVPVGLGTLHQAGGVLVLATSVFVVFESRAKEKPI